MPTVYCVATFYSVHDALNFEKVMKASGIPIQLIPVPRQISSSCGTAAKFSLQYKEKIEEIVSQKNLGLEKIHIMKAKSIPRSNLRRIITKY